MALPTSTHKVTFGDGNDNCGNIRDSFNTTVYKSDKDAEIMRWLSPIEPDNRHHGVRTDRHDGIGDWLLETSEFQEWRGGEGGVDKGVLFCSGNPGVGKTYLSSVVIDRLCDQAREEDIAVAWLYCDFKTQQEQMAINMVGAILKRLVGSEIPQDIRESFREGRRPLLADLKQMLRTAIASLPQVFICIDALDECLPKNLPEFLELLKYIVLKSPKTRIFLTGRPHVKEAIQRYFPKALVMPVKPNTDDIRNYLEMRLNRDDEPEAMDDDLRVDIIESILNKMSDIFLLVSLNVDAILGGVTIGQRRKILEEMERGNGLSDAYTATLARLRAQKGHKSALGLKVLMWVLNSERPLREEELCHALGVETGSPDLDPKNIPTLRTLISSCLGLVTVEASSSTIRLVHFTLQEHLASDPTLFDSSHATIAEVCLTYLNFRSVLNLSPTITSAPSTMPFLEYASFYWGEHTRRGMTEKVKILALGLLNRFDEHGSAQLLFSYYEQKELGYPGPPRVAGESSGFTGLHGIAFFGIVEMVAPVLEMKKWDVNAPDYMGRTALTWATRKGHEEVVKMLLEQEGINPDQADTYYCLTPLSWAAKGGHEGIVEILLQRKDVNSDQADTKCGRTPLSLAVEGGFERVVKILLEREGVNPDQADTEYGRTPLSWAAEWGYEGIVEMLLDRKDVNPDHIDTEYGRTPLAWAAESGYQGIVKMLLEQKGVDPDHADTKNGRTPLSLAAQWGNEEVAKILLERKDVDPNQRVTEDGQVPLSWAADWGYEEIVKMLLEREDFNPNQAVTNDGLTPLLWALMWDHEEILQMLLEREDVDPNQTDTLYGHRPLSFAALTGKEEAVKVLLGRKDVNPNQSFTEDGPTPLSWAVESGYWEIVQMLLEREDVDPNQTVTEYGQTLLSLAVREGNEEVVKMLLGRKDVNPNQVDTEYGRTPLSWAADSGFEEIVKMLLKREDVIPDQADTYYCLTPLSCAAKGGHEGVVKILLERKDVNSDQADTKYGRTPLWWAADGGFEGIVKMLLKREDANPDQADTYYCLTPLSCAAMKGHEGIVEMLLERKDVNPNHIDTGFGQTPLVFAVDNGHEGVVKMLLEQEGVDPDLTDTKGGFTPLSWAAKDGHEGIVEMLLERREVDPNHIDTVCGLTPLLWAANGGFEGIIKILLKREDVDPNQSFTEDGPTLLSWAAENGHEEVVKMLLERKDVNLDQPETACGQTVPTSFSQQQREDFVADMQFRSLDPNIDITDLNGQPGSPSPDSDEPELVSDLKDSVSMSLDHDPPATDSSMLPKPSSLWPFKFLYLPWKSDTHPNNTSPILLIVANRYSVVSYCLYILAFFVSRKDLYNRTSLQLVGGAPARKVWRLFVFLWLKVGLRNWRRQDLRRLRSK